MCAAHEPLVPRVMPPQPTPDHPLPPHTSSASYSEIYNFLSSLMVDQKPPSLSDESECEVEPNHLRHKTVVSISTAVVAKSHITANWKSIELQTLLVKLQTLLVELQTWQYLSDMQTFVCQTPADKGLSRRCGVSTRRWEGLAR